MEEGGGLPGGTLVGGRFGVRNCRCARKNFNSGESVEKKRKKFNYIPKKDHRGTSQPTGRKIQATKSPVMKRKTKQKEIIK